MTEGEVRIWDENGQEQKVEDCESWSTWEKCLAAPGFPKGLVQFLRDKDRGCAFPAPTLIQSYSWPALVTGKDFIGVAKTGSGKTLAFLLPGFMWLKKNLKGANAIDCSIGPAILALTPTRELCYQIYSDAEKFGTPVKITAACAYGGAPKWEQEAALKAGPHTLIATPGRLADFLRSKAVSLENCKYITLDEADRMLDMGFEPQVKEILDWAPKERQISMFTATWPSSIRKLADQYITNPSQVQIGGDVVANSDVTQHIDVVDGDDDKKKLLATIVEESKGAVLVFCNTKAKVKELAWELNPRAEMLHGDMDQKARDEAMRKFKSGEVTILVATDVASRGLDVRSITTVVNYDASKNGAEDYVHRIGRTGRAGDKGHAFTFLVWGDEKAAGHIVEVMENSNITPPEVLRELSKGRFQTGSGVGVPGGAWEKDKDAEKTVEGGDDDKKWEKEEETMWKNGNGQKRAAEEDLDGEPSSKISKAS